MISNFAPTNRNRDMYWTLGPGVNSSIPSFPTILPNIVTERTGRTGSRLLLPDCSYLILSYVKSIVTWGRALSLVQSLNSSAPPHDSFFMFKQIPHFLWKVIVCICYGGGIVGVGIGVGILWDYCFIFYTVR